MLVEVKFPDAMIYSVLTALLYTAKYQTTQISSQINALQKEIGIKKKVRESPGTSFSFQNSYDSDDFEEQGRRF